MMSVKLTSTLTWIYTTKSPLSNRMEKDLIVTQCVMFSENDDINKPLYNNDR